MGKCNKKKVYIKDIEIFYKNKLILEVLKMLEKMMINK